MAAYETSLFNLTSAPFRSRIEWSTVLGLVPAGFDLFSRKQLAAQALELLSNVVHTKRHLSVLGRTQALLRDCCIPILVDAGRAEQRLLPSEDLKRSQRRWLGQIALELYFTQLLRGDTALIDLWPSRLGVDADGDAVWNPRPLYLKWDRRFLSPLRDVYAGFFLEDEARFERGLGELGLGPAGGLLLRHLGEGNQRAVRFSSSQLQSTLSELSTHTETQAAGLHRNFAAFGLYLAGLHELLESLDLAFDVRSAFIRSYSQI